MIAKIITYWINGNKFIISRNQYQWVPIYNIVMILGFPFAILPIIEDWKKGKQE